MRLRDAMALAASSLWCSAVKTLLTILGLGVGVAAVLAVRSLGAAGQAQVEVEIARMGVNKVWITPADAEHHLQPDMVQTAADATGAPVCAGAAAPGLVSLDGTDVAAQIAGYDAGMQAVHGGELLVGRALTAADHRQGNAVCLLDAKLAERLGGDTVGRRVTAGGRRLMVVGVMETLPLPAMAAGSGALAMPLTAYEDTFGAGAQEMTISVPTGMSAGDVSRTALAALGDGYCADTLENEIGAAREIIRIFVMVLSCVAAVCMLTGGIGVMNVLLMSVRERRREIGLMKALGATQAQVGLIFLLEAAGYAFLGGLAGLLLGGVLIRLLGRWIGLRAVLTAGDVLPVLAAAGVLGLAFGVSPAMRAAGLQVVDALRSE